MSRVLNLAGLGCPFVYAAEYGGTELLRIVSVGADGPPSTRCGLPTDGMDVIGMPRALHLGLRYQVKPKISLTPTVDPSIPEWRTALPCPECNNPNAKKD